MIRSRSDLTIVGEGWRHPTDGTGMSVEVAELARWVRTGVIARHVQRYRRVCLLVPSVEYLRRPLALSLAVRSLGRREVVIEDAHGRQIAVDVRFLARLVGRFGRDALAYRGYLRELRSREHRLRAARPAVRDVTGPIAAGAPIVYLTAGVTNGAPSGGEVGHTAGVLNNLRSYAPPLWVTTIDFEPVDRQIPRHVVQPSGRFQDFGELGWFALGDDVLRAAIALTADRQPAFVYQRSSAGVSAGAQLARRHGVPLVLEVNSMAATYARLWDKPLPREELIRRFELLSLRNADLIVAVSEPLANELAELGADRQRILVNPNGVDVDVYSPIVDGSVVRDRYELGGSTVIGFVGTFRPYHGAAVLAEAFVRLLRAREVSEQSVRLMMIGGGPELAATQSIIERAGAMDWVRFTGPVPQSDGPAYMAACDVLASPHVPNPDGTEFFGSPTKLFEYMAMGKAIVASDLAQIGEILDDGTTALLVTPGEPQELADALARTVNDPALRSRLGEAARNVAVERYTWRRHTDRIVEHLVHRAG